MKENELYQNLNHFNIKLGDACEMIFNRTGAYISPKHIRTRFEKYDSLSNPMAAAFKLFFRELENGKIQ